MSSFSFPHLHLSQLPRDMHAYMHLVPFPAWSTFQHQHHDMIKFVSLNNQAKTGAVPQAPVDVSPQEDEREKGMLSFSLSLPLL